MLVSIRRNVNFGTYFPDPFAPIKRHLAPPVRFMFKFCNTFCGTKELIKINENLNQKHFTSFPGYPKVKSFISMCDTSIQLIM